MLKQQASAQPSAAPSPIKTVAPESNVEPVDPKDLAGVWDRLLSALAAKGPGLPPLLAGAKLVGIEDGQAILRYPQSQEMLVRMIDRNGKKDTIRDVLSGLLKQSVGLKFELVEEPSPPEPAVPVAAPARPPQRAAARVVPPPAAPEPAIRLTDELRQQLAQDELIKAVIEKLGGEIVKVE